MSIANELITRGWTQGQNVDDGGRVCLVGAACSAYGVRVWLELPLDVRNALDAAVGTAYEADWNDAPDRTFDEVLRVAKQADELLEAAALREDVSDPEEQIER